MRLATLLVLLAIGCNPLGDHYEDKADKGVKKRRKAEMEQEARAAAKPMKHARDCKQCHATIVDEWKRSMHSRSTAKGDPLFALMLKKAEKELGKSQAAETCRNCHYADWSMEEEKLNREPVGVTCIVCHRIEPRHPKKRLASGKMSELARDHASVGGTQGVCLSCHAEFRNQAGQQVCITGMESKKAQAGKCVDCHMGIAEGSPVASRRDIESHRSHDFVGGHNKRFVRGAARISLAREGEEVVATVKHGRVGHAVPTGNPMRFLVARVEHLDGSGAVIASNLDTDKSPPLGEAPVYMRIFSDAAGHRPVPPFAAVGKPIDTRLQPGDSKEFRVEPVKGAKKVRAVLEYHLAPDKLLKAAGLPTEPVVMSKSQLAL